MFRCRRRGFKGLLLSDTTMKEDKENKKGVPVTATVASDSVLTNNAPVVTNTPRAIASRLKTAISPTKTMANVQKNLDFLYTEYQKQSNSTHGFITNLSIALYLQPREASHYGDFILPRGDKITIRVSNHRPKVSLFDKYKEKDAICFTISSKPRKKIINNGKAHVVEYFYRKMDIENSPKKPLAQIILSIQQLLLTGKFVDIAGLAKRREVNKKSGLKF